MPEESDIPAPASDKPGAASDEHPPWSIRNFPPDTRAAAIAAAKRDRVTVPVWLDAAIREKIQASRRLPAVTQASDKRLGTLEVSEIERLSAVLAETKATTGEPVPIGITRLMYRRVKARLALAPPAPERQDGSPEKDSLNPEP